MKDLSATSVAQNRNMATDRAQGQNLGTRPKLGHYVRLQGGENVFIRLYMFLAFQIPSFGEELKSGIVLARAYVSASKVDIQIMIILVVK